MWPRGTTTTTARPMASQLCRRQVPQDSDDSLAESLEHSRQGCDHAIWPGRRPIKHPELSACPPTPAASPGRGERALGTWGRIGKGAPACSAPSCRNALTRLEAAGNEQVLYESTDACLSLVSPPLPCNRWIGLWYSASSRRCRSAANQARGPAQRNLPVRQCACSPLLFV